ncbi:MAG: molybdopterin-dependent oxidoreductase [Candidatus Aenigmarchaeota archaeon]|nr:molybdopterin-dependent oxidoreductase [Candidatus Aenigmarchaeota archaeon]
MREIALILVIMIMLSAGCVSQTIELDGVEVREYDGERLSSVNDFRENSIAGPQDVDISSYRLRVTGLVENQKEYTYEEAVSLQTYSKVVTLYCVEGWEARILWEGIIVSDLIQKSGIKPEANTVIFHAVDGYTTSLPIGYVTDKDIILAYRMNGVTLPKERGFPFQLVAEDKWGYKWIKWVNEIELSNDPNYRGFWESRGYSNDANIEDSFYD